jgi:predicted HTH domain antitoxin
MESMLVGKRDFRKLLVEVPEEVLASLQQDEAGLARELRLAAAVKWYELGKLSQDRAADLAGLSRSEFLMALARFGVSPFQEEPDDLRPEPGVA